MLLSRIAEELHAGLPEREAEITDVAYDSRKVVPGEKTDGHRFAQQAVDKGAAALIVEEKLPIDVPQLLVTDGREAMARSAACFFDHPERKMTMLAVTGTNGKTSTTYMVKAVAEAAGLKVGLIGTIHNLIGDEVVETERTTPESVDLFRLLAHMVERGVDLVIMEVSSHALAQNRAAGIRFKAALFTNLTQDHLDYHKTLENYKLAKAKLFDLVSAPGVKERKCAVVNIDDEAGATMLEHAKCPHITYAIDREADLRALDVEVEASGTHVLLENQKFCNEKFCKMPLRLHLAGRFNVYNVMSAVGAALAENIEPSIIQKVLESFTAVSGRFELVRTGNEKQDFSIIVDYAHTPDGGENVLKTARQIAKAKIISVFGCGGDRDRTKRPIMGRLAAELSDVVIATSDNPRTEDP